MAARHSVQLKHLHDAFHLIREFVVPQQNLVNPADSDLYILAVDPFEEPFAVLIMRAAAGAAAAHLGLRI